ncbi:UrcA family protein [Brytella acorum]|uniref:UrcA family protein n=1 Tax=Brytella acorum TaxID=2959299 RepID=A0AA35USN3_9PROT|nr:UrcA family protein [Brytella acorum]MDF3624972.1 UrcA family protein [Brytella acorum]CAI9121455.1 UrcA family protein [Brytella acorum]
MFRSSLFVAVLAAASIATPALAQDGVDANSKAIDITNVDLSDHASWKQLDREVDRTAHQICARITGSSSLFDPALEECEKEARQNARQQMYAARARRQASADTQVATVLTLPRG